MFYWYLSKLHRILERSTKLLFFQEDNRGCIRYPVLTLGKRRQNILAHSKCLITLQSCIESHYSWTKGFFDQILMTIMQALYGLLHRFDLVYFFEYLAGFMWSPVCWYETCQTILRIRYHLGKSWKNILFGIFSFYIVNSVLNRQFLDHVLGSVN